MRLTVILMQVVLAVVLQAEQLDSKLLKLIPSDARLVCGIDVDRYQPSVLASLYPVEPSIPTLTEGNRLHQVILILYGSVQHPSQLTIYQGAAGSFVSTGDENGYQALDAATAVSGDEDSVSEAMARWVQPEPSVGQLAARVKALVETYDLWVIASRPLENMDRSPATPITLKYRANFTQLIQEVQAGIRLGGFDDFTVDATMPSFEDAFALAAMGRWLPGVIQSANPNGEESALVDLADNLTTTIKGNVASLSFSLDEIKLRALIESRRAPSPVE